MTRTIVNAALVVALVANVSSPVHAKEHRESRRVEIPHCSRSLGTAAVHIPPEAKDWWSGQNLSSPETIVKAIVKESGCFTLVDRGAAMQMADQERARAASGTLQHGSNIGRGQVRAADYIIVPTLMSQNSHAGGTGLGALLGFIPGIGSVASAIAGGVNISKKTADVHLEIVNVRSSEVSASADGHAKKSDLGWGGGGAAVGSGGFGAFGATGYTDTEIGQVIMTAYVDAYTKLVTSLNAPLSPLPMVAGSNSPAAPPIPSQDSVTTIRVGTLRASASISGRIVRQLPAGTTLYPTGGKSGNWIEVADEIGSRGWISTLSVNTQQ
jgi:curli biogenesis system outer membrane secretion channel CsgG